MRYIVGKFDDKGQQMSDFLGCLAYHGTQCRGRLPVYQLLDVDYDTATDTASVKKEVQSNRPTNSINLVDDSSDEVQIAMDVEAAKADVEPKARPSTSTVMFGKHTFHFNAKKNGTHYYNCSNKRYALI